MKFQDWILDNAEHIADVLQSESGKPGVEAAMEAPMCADVLNYWARRRSWPTATPSRTTY